MEGKIREIPAVLRVVGLASMVLFLFTGCASIVQGTTQVINFTSSPPDAQIKVFDREGKMIVQENTPYIATLNRGKGFFRGAKYHVVIEKEGYATREIDVEGRLSGWYLGGNLIFGGLIGYLIVDPASGAMWTLTPKEVDAELGEQTTLLMQDEGLMVVLSQQVPPALQQKMKPVN